MFTFRAFQIGDDQRNKNGLNLGAQKYILNEMPIFF